MTVIIEPGRTIGILGAGQLGRMLALRARAIGYRVAVYGGGFGSPCGQVSDAVWDAAFDDEDRLREFAAAVDVITYEFENVPARTAAVLSACRPLCPGVLLLSTAQNRLEEKTALTQLGLPTARFRMVSSAQGLALAREDFGGAVILKANTEGYDGKGQWAVDADTDVQAVWTQSELQQGLVEARVAFEYELSIVAGRYADGRCDFYPPLLNHHHNHILDVSVLQAPQVTAQVAQQAQQMARVILEQFQVVGVLCVELFLTADGQLLVNEIAPRPHNSGHLTIEAFNCSQFELQLRTVCNLPGVDLTPRAPAAAMSNLLGQHLPEFWSARALSGLETPDVYLHLYGKPESRTNRKVGHITVLGQTPEAVESQVRRQRDRLLS